MLYKIQNTGQAIDLFVDGVQYFISRHEIKNTENDNLVKEARKHASIRVIELYEEMNYFELLKMAKQRGIEMKKRVKKNELVKILRREWGEKKWKKI